MGGVALRLVEPLASQLLYTSTIYILANQQETPSSVFVLALMSAITVKLFSVYSQKLELDADKESIRLSKDPAALIHCLKKIEDNARKNHPVLHLISSFFPSPHPGVETRKKALEYINDRDSSYNCINRS